MATKTAAKKVPKSKAQAQQSKPHKGEPVTLTGSERSQCGQCHTIHLHVVEVSNLTEAKLQVKHVCTNCMNVTAFPMLKSHSKYFDKKLNKFKI